MRTSLFFGVLLVSASVLGAQAGTDAEITIRLVNSAKVAREILARGESHAGYVLAHAGIEVAWHDCSAGAVGLCSEEVGAREFWLHVANWKPMGRKTLGFTAKDNDSAVSASVAGVYYPMVQKMSASFQIEEAQILGAALAHEIGHLLGASHTPTGVMRSQFNRRCIVELSQGRLFFSRDQATRMRANVNQRNPTLEVSQSSSARSGQ